MQLEQADRLQGFKLSADVTSGAGSLASLLIENFMLDEAPKAPILLYASEGSNPFREKLAAGDKSDTNLQYKHDLFELN